MKRLAIGALILSVLAVAVLTRDGDDQPQAAVKADYTRTCQLGNSVRFRPHSPRDEVLPGGAELDAFRGNFANAKAENVYSPRPGLEALKAPLAFRGRRDVTIAVPRSHRAVLGLDFAPERRGVDTVAEAHSSVRFRACPRGEATGYPGGLLYSGPWPACVPLYVSVGGRRSQRHLVSLGAGPCQAPK